MAFREKMAEEEVRIPMTKEEHRKYGGMRDVNDPELLAWMAEKGIEFDQGLIKITIDGVNHLFNTDREDFGTTSYPEDKLGA